MDLKQALDKLKEFNTWRRGADIPMPNPKEIGTAIDIAIQTCERVLNEIPEEYKKGYALEYAQLRYANQNGKSTENEMQNVQACCVGYRAGWNSALKYIDKGEKHIPFEGILNIKGYTFIKETNHDKDKCILVTNDYTKEQTKPLKETD